MRTKSIGFLFVVLLAPFFSIISLCQDDMRVWKEFLALVREGKMTLERIKPYDELGEQFGRVLLEYLDSLRVDASPEDWNQTPEVIRVENRLEFIVPWTTGNEKVSYCFSFLVEGSSWYFQHLEAVFIRLDKISLLPASTFPDIPEDKKNWAREEIYWSFVILNVYLPVSKDKGKEYALNLMKDGAGYFVGAKAWVPFVSPSKAFILYLCWEQARLRGNGVTLLKLDDRESVVRLSTHYFTIYMSAAHLKPLISMDEYKELFETIWKDRAKNAGWDIEISYSGEYEVTFKFKR